MLPADMRNRFDNITFNIPTPSGPATIIVVEESPGKIYKIFFTIGKAGSDVNAWAFALAESVVFILKTQPINIVLELLSNITSSRSSFTMDGIVCRSGPEALYTALFRYRSMGREPTTVKYSDDFTPSRMKN